MIASTAKPTSQIVTIRRDSHHEPLMERFAPYEDAPQTQDALADMVQRLNAHTSKALFTDYESRRASLFGIVKRVMACRQMSKL